MDESMSAKKECARERERTKEILTEYCMYAYIFFLIDRNRQIYIFDV